MSIPSNIIRKLYGLFPHAEDSVDTVCFRSLSKNPRIVATSLLPDHAIRILDICSGSGGSAMPVARAKQNARITCVDGSEGMLNVF